MNILFIGLGSIGRKHTRLIHQHYPQHRLFAFSRSGKKHDIPYIQDIFELDKLDPDVTFICSPTYMHLSDAIQLAKKKSHLFIEKPICSNTKDFFKLIELVHKHNLTCYIAYPFRFHKDLNALQQELRLFKNVYFNVKTNIDNWGKQSYSFKKQYGGGAIFELSHELDFAVNLFGRIITYDIYNVKHKKYNINAQSRISLYHEFGATTKFSLSLVDDIEIRKITYGESASFIYIPTEDMYVDQIKYFFKNLKNPRLVNNIFSASDLFFKIIEMENK